ncbi:hypothetical protein FG386_001897 [Cryptosporidium ryanae]|uniref:uncharacterized protein n=1 Tax=Cryptosporidium ryanae TaxID=515981 RepID=UPI00351A3155|nr:hypothetical protein FG386_001897 [Cryptosporidium ryanae]
MSRIRPEKLVKENKSKMESVEMGIQLHDVFIPDNEEAKKSQLKNRELANKYSQ